MKIVKEVWFDVCKQSSMEIDEPFLKDLNYSVKLDYIDNKICPVVDAEDVSNVFKGIHNERLDESYTYTNLGRNSNYSCTLFNLIYDTVSEWLYSGEFKIIDESDEGGNCSDYVED